MNNNYWVFRSYFELEEKKISYTDVFYIKNYNIYEENENIEINFNYSYRTFFFSKINEFISLNCIVKHNFLNIILNYYKTLWNIFLFKKDLNYYYYLLKISFIKYNNMYNYEINPTIYTSLNIINFLNLKRTTINFFSNFEIKKIENIFKNNWEKSLYGFFLMEDNYYLKISEYNKYDFGENNFLLNFLRIQRRYNKRRYSKVRSWSRSPFFAGISLSSIFLAMFWIGTVKSVDWNNIFIINININLFLMFSYIYVYYRYYRLNFLKNSIRKKNKIKIINNLNKIFFFDWFINKNE